MDWLWKRIAAHVPQPEAIQLTNSLSLREGATPEGIFREAAARQLDVQIDANHALDTRNATIVSIGTTVITIAFGLLSITKPDLPQTAIWSLRVSVCCFVFLLMAAGRATLFRGLSFRPDLVDLAEYSERFSGPTLERWVAIEYTRSADENEEIVARKARWVGVANVLLYVEGLTLALAAMRTLL